MKCLRNNIGLLIIFQLVTFSTIVSSDSDSWKFSENNNNVIRMQTQGGDPEKSGDVKIEFYGHMAFKITSPEGLSILIDPWRNDPSGVWGRWFPNEFPETAVDIVISTHAHFDHDAVYRPHAIMVLERMAGELKLGDVKITGIAEKHMCKSKGWYKWTDVAKEFSQEFCPPNNYLHMDNFIQIIETGGLRIAHWGDNRPDLSKFANELLKNIDILIMNIDGSSHILSYQDIDDALKRYQPRVVIPGHYYTKGASSVLTTLDTADEWVDRQDDVVRLKESELILNPDKINSFEQRIYYFGMNHIQ
ncbi:MAG TPA: Zn-dependent hydrolase [Thiotrichaceae bacterium]|jgi:L-ascorbate metabolism protein UlaG (beta-lactamase superfamily)|nr:Zn-dependent hydrolase [Thiotrichaceae bacterium]HIM08206.1 Zn-dependent hydrolase [Gammaproteobacteria bacterium]